MRSSRAINRVFTRNVVKDLLLGNKNEVFDYVVQRYVEDPESKTHSELFSEIYTYLGEEKRNEYYYMNTLLNKLLVGIHNVNTTTALSQLRIGQHIADFVMINGEGTVYEIKSDLDNFGRLSDQLGSYFKAFSRVSVLSTLNEHNKVKRLLDHLGEMGDAVGIYLMNDSDTYFSRSSRREPKQFDDYLDHGCIFGLLRKKEYENVLMESCGELPRVAPVFYYRACLEQFQKIPILVAQGLAMKELKKRNKITRTAFEGIQRELKSVVYFSGLSRKLPDIDNLLKSTYRR